MITVRKIFTKEMNKIFAEEGILSDEALVAYLDTHRALINLLKNPIFSSVTFTLHSWSSSYGLLDREKRTQLTFDQPELVIKTIPSSELLDRISSGDEQLTVSYEEVIQLLDFCNHVLNLTDFDPIYFFLLRFFIAGVSVDATGWLTEMTKGIAQA